MPVVKVSWWAGRSKEDRASVAKGITEVLHAVGIPNEATHVVFEDVPKENWAIGGVLASERPTPPAPR